MNYQALVSEMKQEIYADLKVSGALDGISISSLYELTPEIEDLRSKFIFQIELQHLTTEEFKKFITDDCIFSGAVLKIIDPDTIQMDCRSWFDEFIKKGRMC